MPNRQLFILPAHELMTKLHGFLGFHYWLKEEEVVSTSHWLISTYLSKLGLFQVNTVLLTNNISNPDLLLSRTRWMEREVYRLFLPISGRVDYMLDKLLISPTDIYVWGE